MDFFIPGTRDAADAESVFAAVVDHISQTTGVRASTRKVQSIEFSECGFRERASVGTEFEYETVSCIVEVLDSFLSLHAESRPSTGRADPDRP